MRNWRRSPAIALIVMAVVVSAQFLIPVSRLGPPHTPDRFAWQMYSNVSKTPDFVVITASGRQKVDIDQFMVQKRAEIDLTQTLPAHLCAIFPDATEVTWETGGHQCSTG